MKKRIFRRACPTSAGILPFLARGIAIGAVLFGFAVTPNRAQQNVFYALGSDDGSKRNRLYEVDAKSLQVVRSLEVDEADSGMLTGKRDSIVLSGGGSRAWLVSAPDLKISSSFAPDPAPGRIGCLQHTFVNPLNGLAYFSCDFGSGGTGMLILDMVRQKVTADLPQGPVLPADWPKRLSLSRPTFAYDGKTNRLYLVGSDVVILDPRNQPVDYVVAHDAAKAAGLDATSRYRIKLAVLPDSNVLLWLFSGVPHLLLYDPLSHKILQTWTETQTYTKSEPNALATAQKSRDVPLWFGLPVPSRDGTLLFAESAGGNYFGLILFNSTTLQVLRRWAPPEKPRGDGLAPAPDGRGMWFFGESGKIYRLDDHTGELIEEVKLPFHLVSLIREP